MRLYIGLDVHQSTSTYCILDPNQPQKPHTVTVRGGHDQLLEQLRQLKGQLHICYEASIGYGHLHDRLAAFCQRVVVAHPGRLRLIFRSKRKNDRVDAQKLAKLLLLDEVPQVHVPDVDVRSWRELIETRRRLIDHRTRVKNSLRALLRSFAIRGCKSLWSKKGIAWLEALDLPTHTAQLRRQLGLAQLAAFESQIRLVTAELDKIAKTHPGVALLRTIAGVGARTAETFIAYVDHPHRFKRINRIGTYLGLVPCQDASASVNRLGHLTKEGPATMRKYLVEASWQFIRRCPNARALFDRVSQGKRERRKIALVAVAHQLARTMLSMLKSGETYRTAPDPATAPAAAA